LNFFISDTHFGHGNIIRYCKRPFLQSGDLDIAGNWISSYIAQERTKQHDSFIIKNINNKVGEDDTLFHLGDFCMTKSSEANDAPKKAFDYYRNQLKCKNIIFIKGNHDSNNTNKTIIESLIIQHGGKRVYLTHNPKFAKEEFIWNFCGHTHGSRGIFTKIGKKSVIIDLSVDCWKFGPVEINEINQAFSDWCRKGCKNKNEVV
jgi:calcineurin-like phosphoesterase family protein